MAATAFSLRDLHVGMYGAVMGLVGLGLTARAAAPLFPGVFRAPAYFTELWAGLGMIAFLFLAFAYLGKILVNPEGAKQEFLNPAALGFCGTLPVGMSLVAGALAPYAPALASELWWASVALFAAFFA